ncbi:hypothetical protein ACEPAI_8866 [Sanghuangporus weigelae]
MASTNASVPAVSERPVIHLDDSLGAAFIGLLFAAILFGVTNVQSLIYYQNSTRDPLHMKWTIAFLWVLDTLHLALISHTMYFYMVTNFTNLLTITDPTWSLCLHVIVTTFSDFIVRLFYARRVWIMSKRNWFLTSGVLIFTSVTFISGLGFGIKIFSYSSTLEFTKLSWVLYTSLGSAVAADIWVATTLCFFLARSRSGFKSTDTKVNALILYIINTGLFTSLCATASFVTFAVMPHNYIFIGFYFSLPKLYFNALLAMLNARERLREGSSNSGSSGGGGAYRLPRILSVSSPGTTKHAGSFGTVVPASPARNEFNIGDKENHTLAVTVRTETNYHTDESSSDRYTSVLPL